jgi:Ca2+-binding RTX toxin-like protein
LVAGGYYAADFLGRGCPTTYPCDAGPTAEIFRLGEPPKHIGPICKDDRTHEQPATSRTACKGEPATIVGTEGNDVRRGTPSKDVIAGLGGDDKLRGLAGNDVICGGAGNDTLKGGKGRDKLYGEVGKDKLKGGPGKDKLKGGPGRDKQLQ